VTPEEMALTFEGYAASCDRQAIYQRNRERVERLQVHHDLAVTNEAKAEALRWAAQRIREEMS
jgi:hypothetical protein